MIQVLPGLALVAAAEQCEPDDISLEKPVRRCGAWNWTAWSVLVQPARYRGGVCHDTQRGVSQTGGSANCCCAMSGKVPLVEGSKRESARGRIVPSRKAAHPTRPSIASWKTTGVNTRPNKTLKL